MFDFVRNNKRVMQGALLLLIVPSFVLVGLESYQDRGSANEGVATVAGQKVTQQEWDDAQRRQIDRARQMMGEQFDQKLFETPEAKQAVLNNLVAERAINAEINRNHMTVSDQSLMKTLLQIPGFRKPDGSLDGDAYKAFAASQGMTRPMFEQRLARDLAAQQVSNAIQATAFAPRSVTARLSNINDQEREVQELIFPITNFLPQVKAEYVVFDQAVVESQVQVSDAEVAEYYNKNLKAYTTPEQRTASHILFTVARDAKPADEAAAKAKAKAALAEVRKNPANFAAVAKAQSQDPGSAQAGGDLGVVEKGLFVKPVEDAIYALKEGEIGNLVKSEFGWHVIKVTSVKPATQKPLEAAKDEIVADLKKQKMSKKYSELAETFGNTVYEQSDSLKPVADKLGLKIQTVDNLTRKPNPALGDSPVNNEKFLTALFSVDAVKNKRNTEAVEVAPSVLVSGRVLEFRPAAKRPLAAVEAQIRQRVTIEEAARLARAAGEQKLAAVKASGDATGFGEAKIVSRTKEPPFNPTGAIAALKADVTKLPAYVGVELPGQGYAVYRIGKVAQPAQPDQARRQQEAEQIGGIVGQQEMLNYIEALKVKAKAKVTAKAAETKAE